VITGSEDDKAAAAGRSRRRASRGDREQAIDVLKAAFVQGRLTKDEFDARIGLTFTGRTCAEVAAVTADLPARPAGARPLGQRSRPRSGHAVRWGAAGFITPAIIAAAFVVASVRGTGYEVVGFLIAFAYFMVWLSIGTNMLWEWHCMSVPSAGMCVRCAHTAASHRTSAACSVRLDPLNLRRRCSCAGYVPPGTSPETDDLDLLPARSLPAACLGGPRGGHFLAVEQVRDQVPLPGPDAAHGDPDRGRPELGAPAGISGHAAAGSGDGLGQAGLERG